MVCPDIANVVELALMLDVAARRGEGSDHFYVLVLGRRRPDWEELVSHMQTINCEVLTGSNGWSRSIRATDIANAAELARSYCL